MRTLHGTLIGSADPGLNTSIPFKYISDFHTPTDCVPILNQRGAVMDASMDVADLLLSCPTSLLHSCNHILQTLEAPFKCFAYVFTFQASRDKVARQLQSINSALEVVLQRLDLLAAGGWKPLADMNLCHDLVMGGHNIIQGCCTLPDQDMLVCLGQMLNLGLVQRVLCLMCWLLNRDTPISALTLNTHFQIMTRISRMLGVLRRNTKLQHARQLAGPFTAEACMLLLSASTRDVSSLRSVTTLIMLMEQVAYFDNSMQMSPSMQQHRRCMPCMPRLDVLQELAKLTRDSPYAPGSVVVAHRLAHTWPGAERSCCYSITLLSMLYRLMERVLLKQRPGAAAAGARAEPGTVSGLTDLSNYGRQFISTLTQTLQQTGRTISSPMGQDSWQLIKLRHALVHVPVSGMEATLRFLYRTPTPVQLAVDLFLTVLCGPSSLSAENLSAFVSTSATVLKLVVANPCLRAGRWTAGLVSRSAAQKRETISWCLRGLAMLQNWPLGRQQSQQLEHRTAKALVELTANLAAMLTHDCAGTNRQEQSVRVTREALARMQPMEGVRDVGVLLLDGVGTVPLSIDQGIAWSRFAADRDCVNKCGYRFCPNLEGLADSALPYLLCSGCRRVKYCSVKCQKLAWKCGGHPQVCHIVA